MTLEDLEVIGAGFGRTGTLSLKEALEQLGFGPCHHMYELYGRPDDIDGWIDAARRGDADWQALLQGCRSTTDWPVAAFWEELLVVAPHVKVILTTRDSEGWLASFQSTIQEVWRTGDPANPLLQLSKAVVMERVLQNSVEDSQSMIEAYEAHNQRVRDTVRPDQLLEFEVADGWGPLCAFLGVPVPDTEFPHANDRAFFQRLFGLSESHHVM